MDEVLAGGSLLGMLLLLSTFIEWAVERLFGSIKQLKGWPLILISAAGGVLLCTGLNLDALKIIGFEGEYTSWIGQVITGIIVGSGSNAIHKFIAPSVKK